MLYIWCLEMNLFLFVLNFSNFSTVKETWAVIGLPAESGIMTCHTQVLQDVTIFNRFFTFLCSSPESQCGMTYNRSRRFTFHGHCNTT